MVMVPNLARITAFTPHADPYRILDPYPSNPDRELTLSPKVPLTIVTLTLTFVVSPILTVMAQASYSFAAGTAYGGACFYVEGVDNYITGSTFADNAAVLSGGAVAVQG